MNLAKEEIRQKLKTERLKLKPEEIAEISQKIAGRFMQTIDLKNIRSLHSYIPIAKLKEIDTEPLLNLISQLRPDIKITLQAPRKDNITLTEKFDLVLVPTLGFDTQGIRLGWGGGFYDRFLARQPEALKIGLCPQQGYIKDGLPREPHDVPLDKVITEAI